MNQGIIRKLLGDDYQYRRIPIDFEEVEIAKYKSSLQRKFSIATKSWTDNLHSEWTARMYLATKMIYSSTLLLNTAFYSRSKNILITEPYLLYYSILNCCRALLFAHPNQVWKDGELIKTAHTKIINGTTQILTELNKELGSEFKVLLESAKDFRELHSYKFPGDGFRNEAPFKDITMGNIEEKCELLCEIAQLTSECFEKSFDKNCTGGNYNLKRDILQNCFRYEGHQYQLTDVEDNQRISYILRRVQRPHNIYHTMTEGMTEDFFGNWTADESCEDDSFDPDRREIIIFNMP